MVFFPEELYCKPQTKAGHQGVCGSPREKNRLLFGNIPTICIRSRLRTLVGSSRTDYTLFETPNWPQGRRRANYVTPTALETTILLYQGEHLFRRILGDFGDFSN